MEQPVAVATACRVLLTMPASWMPSAAVNRRDVNAAHGNHFDEASPAYARYRYSRFTLTSGRLGVKGEWPLP